MDWRSTLREGRRSCRRLRLGEGFLGFERCWWRKMHLKQDFISSYEFLSRNEEVLNYYQGLFNISMYLFIYWKYVVHVVLSFDKCAKFYSIRFEIRGIHSLHLIWDSSHAKKWPLTPFILLPPMKIFDPTLSMNGFNSWQFSITGVCSARIYKIGMYFCVCGVKFL